MLAGFRTSNTGPLPTQLSSDHATSVWFDRKERVVSPKKPLTSRSKIRSPISVFRPTPTSSYIFIYTLHTNSPPVCFSWKEKGGHPDRRANDYDLRQNLFFTISIPQKNGSVEPYFDRPLYSKIEIELLLRHFIPQQGIN